MTITPIRDAADTVLTLPGFIEPAAVETTPVRSVFVCSGNAPSPLYLLDGDRRQYLPASFVGSVFNVSVIERDYAQAEGLVQKLVLNCLVANEPYAFWMGLNTWAAQSLLQALTLLDADDLQSPLLFKAVKGMRTTFFNVAVHTDGEWKTVTIAEDNLKCKLEADELELMAGAVNELLN